MKKMLLALLACFALVAAACGSGSDSATPTADDPGGDATQTAADDSSTDDGSTGDGGDDPTTDDTSDDGSDDSAANDGTDANAGGDTPVKGNKLSNSVLASAFATDGDHTSARFEGTFTFSGGEFGSGGDASMTFSGAYDLSQNASEMTVDFGSLMTAVMEADGGGDAAGIGALGADFFEDPLTVITIGDTSWIQWSLLSLFTGQDDVWLEETNDGSGDLTSEFGFSGTGGPTEMLESLKEANAEIEEIGTESVRGVDTTHYRAILDLDALSQEMTPEQRAEFEAELGTTTFDDLPIDFWIDADGLLRRYVMDLSDPAMMAGTDGSFERAEIVFEMYDYGVSIDIAPPPADQVITADSLGFGG